MTPDRSNFSRTVEATAAFSSDITSKFERLYPLVSDPLDNNFKRFSENEIPFVSFEVGSPVETILLIEGLKRAVDKNQPTTHARHANDKHVVFPDAVEILIQYLKNKNGPIVDRRFQDATVLYDKKSGVSLRKDPEKISVPRLLIETPRFNRETYEPAPFLAAKLIRGNEKDELRLLMKQKGMPFAVFTCLYRKLDKNTIFKYLGNQQYITDNDLKRRFNGIILQDKYRGENERHVQILQNILNENTSHLPFSQDTYQKAVDYAATIGWIKPNERPELFGNVKVDKTPFARAVFQGGYEVAYKLASTDFKDPEKTRFLEKRFFSKDKKIATTRLLTAFLVFD